MTKATEREGFDLPSWKFRVTRLGCVESGEIEVKPLTLLCGPNNTGKTWVMYALYGFLRSPVPVFPGFDKLLEELQQKGEYLWNFKEWFGCYGNKLISMVNENICRRLLKVFDADSADLSGAEFLWVIGLDDLERLIALNLKSWSSREPDYVRYFDINKVVIRNQNGDKPVGFSVKLMGVILFFGILEVPLFNNVFLMPAERGGLHVFFKELSNYRTSILHPSNRATGLGLAGFADGSNIKLASYSEPIADYIDWLNGLRTTKKNKSKLLFKNLSERIKKLVGGQYEVDAEGEIAFTPRQVKDAGDSEQKLAFHLTSSTVKSLFPLWFYLEHQAKPGDVLMIDEPELNLHPANQRAVARVLARLVNAGIRVVCSTHSDYIVREINSLIMLSRPHPKRDELMRRFGYEEEELLKPEQVGAYVFDNGRIDAMPITEDEGIEAQTFDQQIHELNETSDKIYYTYRDSETEETP